MNLLELACGLNLLAIAPFVPAALAIWSGKVCSTSSAEYKSKPACEHFIATAVLIVVFLGAGFYLVEIGSFNGLIDSDKLFRANSGAANLEFAWSCSWYALGAGGLLFAFLFFKQAKRLSSSNTPAKLRYFYGAVCLLYGLALPFIMQVIVGGIRDSHLMN